jgi:hypothetical protein
MPSYVDAVEEYLTRRERAGTRRLPGPAPLLARTVVELCALWAVHCHFDPRPPHPAPTRPSPSTTRQSPRCSPNLSSGLVMLRRSCPCPALPDRPGTTRPARHYPTGPARPPQCTDSRPGRPVPVRPGRPTAWPDRAAHGPDLDPRNRRGQRHRRRPARTVGRARVRRLCHGAIPESVFGPWNQQRASMGLFVFDPTQTHHMRGVPDEQIGITVDCRAVADRIVTGVGPSCR